MNDLHSSPSEIQCVPKNHLIAKTAVQALAVLLSAGLLLTACNKDKKKADTENTTAASTAPTTQAVVEVKPEELPKIEAYISSVVNGDFRRTSGMQDFENVSQLSVAAITGNGLLERATKSIGLTSIPRQNFEDYLKEYFNAEITLPATASYGPNYNADTDSFSPNYELEARNFTPSTFWLDATVSSKGQDIYFEAYECNYEYVNTETGAEEVDNPLARIVVDDVTIGFSAPIIRHDIHLIDHRPLAKTRYTLRRNAFSSYQMISKTKLTRDETYKLSAQKMFDGVKATTGTLANLGGETLNIREWASLDSTIFGNLQEGTYIWYVDVLPQTGFALGAPAADGPVFDYKLGFGFMSKDYIR